MLGKKNTRSHKQTVMRETKQRSLIFQDKETAMRVVVDMNSGVAFMTDGEAVNIVGKFDKRGTKQLMNNGPKRK